MLSISTSVKRLVTSGEAVMLSVTYLEHITVTNLDHIYEGIR